MSLEKINIKESWNLYLSFIKTLPQVLKKSFSEYQAFFATQNLPLDLVCNIFFLLSIIIAHMLLFNVKHINYNISVLIFTYALFTALPAFIFYKLKDFLKNTLSFNHYFSVFIFYAFLHLLTLWIIEFIPSLNQILNLSLYLWILFTFYKYTKAETIVYILTLGLNLTLITILFIPIHKNIKDSYGQIDVYKLFDRQNFTDSFEMLFSNSKVGQKTFVTTIGIPIKPFAHAERYQYKALIENDRGQKKIYQFNITLFKTNGENFQVSVQGQKGKSKYVFEYDIDSTELARPLLKLKRVKSKNSNESELSLSLRNVVGLLLQAKFQIDSLNQIQDLNQRMAQIPKPNNIKILGLDATYLINSGDLFTKSTRTPASIGSKVYKIQRIATSAGASLPLYLSGESPKTAETFKIQISKLNQ